VKLGLITTGLLQHEFEPGLDVVCKLGLQAIELGCGGFHSKRYADPQALLADPGRFARWRAAFEERSLEISALAIHGAPLSPDPAESVRYEQEFADACRLAEQLGVSRLTLLAGLPEGGPGDRTPSWVTSPFPPWNLEALQWQWEQRLIPYWREKAKIAADHGCRLCFEMSPSDMVFNPQSLQRLRAEVGEAVGCNLDPSHLFWQQIDPTEVIRELGSLIWHVHAKDTRIQEPQARLNGVLDPNPHGEVSRRSWLFRTVGYGHDEFFWRDFVSELRAIGYDDVVSIEHEDDLIDADEGLEKAVALLRGVLIERPVGQHWWETMGVAADDPGSASGSSSETP
jgi:sugar phosphate isomerase/epimerase